MVIEIKNSFCKWTMYYSLAIQLKERAIYVYQYDTFLCTNERDVVFLHFFLLIHNSLELYILYYIVLQSQQDSKLFDCLCTIQTIYFNFK